MIASKNSLVSVAPKVTLISFGDGSKMKSANKFDTDVKMRKRLKVNETTTLNDLIVEGNTTFKGTVTGINIDNNGGGGGTTDPTAINNAIATCKTYTDNQTGWGLNSWTIAGSVYSKTTDSLIAKIVTMQNSYATKSYVDVTNQSSKGLSYYAAGTFPTKTGGVYYVPVTTLIDNSWLILKDNNANFTTQGLKYQHGNINPGYVLTCADADGTVEWRAAPSGNTIIQSIHTDVGSSNIPIFSLTDDKDGERGFYFYPNKATVINGTQNNIALLGGSGAINNNLEYNVTFGVYSSTDELIQFRSPTNSTIGQTYISGGMDGQFISLDHSLVINTPTSILMQSGTGTDNYISLNGLKVYNNGNLATNHHIVCKGSQSSFTSDYIDSGQIINRNNLYLDGDLVTYINYNPTLFTTPTLSIVNSQSGAILLKNLDSTASEQTFIMNTNGISCNLLNNKSFVFNLKNQGVSNSITIDSNSNISGIQTITSSNSISQNYYFSPNKYHQIYINNNDLYVKNGVSGSEIIFQTTHGTSLNTMIFDDVGDLIVPSSVNSPHYYFKVNVDTGFYLDTAQNLVTDIKGTQSLLIKTVNDLGNTLTVSVDKNGKIKGYDVEFQNGLFNNSITLTPYLNVYCFKNNANVASTIFEMTLPNVTPYAVSDSGFVFNVINRDGSSNAYRMDTLGNFRTTSVLSSYLTCDTTLTLANYSAGVYGGAAISKTSNSFIINAGDPDSTTFTLKIGSNQCIINSALNCSGLNSINVNTGLIIGTDLLNPKKIYLSSSPDTLVIENGGASSSISFKTHNNIGTTNTISMNSNGDLVGINNLSLYNLYWQNSLIDFTRLSQIRYITPSSTMTAHTQVISTPGNGIYLIPKLSTNPNPWNTIIQTGDNAIVSDNGSLSIVTPATSQVGVRLSSSYAELYTPKVATSSGLTFSDNTIQTTAMTTAYLTSFITNLITSQNLIPAIPVGTIFPYGGTMYAGTLDNNSNAPTGYLFCSGAAALITSYPALYNVIGGIYNNGQQPPTGYFYLPNLKGAFLKGIGTNNTWTDTDPVANTGIYQQQVVGKHYHRYVDRGDGVKQAAASAGTGGTNVATTGSGNYTTSDGILATGGNTGYTTFTTTENRPNCVCVSYIIKY